MGVCTTKNCVLFILLLKDIIRCVTPLDGDRVTLYISHYCVCYIVSLPCLCDLVSCSSQTAIVCTPVILGVLLR